MQYTREVLFSNLVDLMGQVVLNLQPSVHAAYQARQETLDASAKAVYDKLAGVEPGPLLAWPSSSGTACSTRPRRR